MCKHHDAKAERCTECETEAASLVQQVHCLANDIKACLRGNTEVSEKLKHPALSGPLEKATRSTDAFIHRAISKIH